MHDKRLIVRLFWIKLLFFLFSKSILSRKIGYFWHLTDFHLDVNYTAFGDIRNGCRAIPSYTDNNENEQVFSGQYGEYVCDTPIALVRSVTRAMLEKGGTTPDFVLWTGDNCGPVEYGECSAKNVIKTTHVLRTELANIINVGGTMGYPAPGLKDAAIIYSNNQSAKPEQGLEGIFSQVGFIFRYWMEDDMLITFTKGGYYSHMYSPYLRIIALNTFLFTEEIPYESDPLGQWTWLEEQLKEASFKKQKVYLVYSAPPGIYEKVYHPPGVHWFHFDHNRHFLHIIRSFSDVIAGQFAGQYHSDVFRVIYSENAEPISWIYMNPSVSPNFKDLPPFVASNHPGIRLYKYDATTAQVLDYTQFYLDLNLANFRSHDEWEYGYSFTTFYSLPSLSAKSLQLLLTRLENDESFLDRYFHASNTMFPRKRHVMASRYPKEGKDLKSFRRRILKDLEGCGPMCKRYHICSAVHLEYDRFLECILAAGAESTKCYNILVIQYMILTLALITVVV